MDSAKSESEPQPWTSYAARKRPAESALIAEGRVYVIKRSSSFVNNGLDWVSNMSNAFQLEKIRERRKKRLGFTESLLRLNEMLWHDLKEYIGNLLISR